MCNVSVLKAKQRRCGVKLEGRAMGLTLPEPLSLQHVISSGAAPCIGTWMEVWGIVQDIKRFGHCQVLGEASSPVRMVGRSGRQVGRWRGWCVMLVAACTVQTINSSSSEYSCRSWQVSQVYCVALASAGCPAPKLFPGCKGPVAYRLVEKCHPPCQVMPGNEVPSLSRTQHHSTCLVLGV